MANIAMRRTLFSALCQLSLATLGAVFLCTSAAAQIESERVLEEITVYAQKRAESAQSVPVAVTAMTAEMIQESGMLDIVRLSELHPSVFFDTAQSWQRNSLKIRGIGTIGNTRSFEGAVGVFIDGVYRSRSGMALADLLDVEHLEVLRGPQSTLFGKNTVAGAIALSSVRPDPDAMEGHAEIRFGNHDFRYLTGAVNIPVGDTAALRLAVVDNQRDGFFQSPDTGDEYDVVDRYAYKAQFLFALGDDWEINVAVDRAKSDAPCCWGSAQVVNGPTSGLIDTYSTLNGFTFVSAPLAEEDRANTLNEVPRELVEDFGILATVNWDPGNNWSFKSITANRNWAHSQLRADPDFVPADLFILSEPAEIDSFSQEFNLNYSTERLDLLLGLYYSTEDYWSERSAESGSDADNYLNALISVGFGSVACLPPVIATDCLFPVGIEALLPDGEFSREIYNQDSSGFAIFAHATTTLSDKFDLVTGLRYDVIDKDGGVQNLFWYDSAVARATLAAAGIPDDGTARNGLDVVGTFNSPSFTDSIKNKEVTGTLQLLYHLNENGMLYGGYHRGFKAGGVNLFREGFITNTTYEPEIADNFEIGLKLEYMGGRARTNAVAFHTTFSDLQINFFNGLEFRTENTGESSTQGIEIENLFQVNENLRLELSATYLDATFDEIDNPQLSYLVGRDTSRAPTWAGVAAFRYDWQFARDWVGHVRGLASYTGSHFVGADVPSEEKVSSYVIADATIGVSGPDERWDASIWCGNCFDESYRTIYFNSTFQPDSFSVYLNDPRRYGLSLRVRF